MPLRGQSFAGWGQRFAQYLRGDEFDTLTPVGGGAGVPFIPDEEARAAEPSEGGLVVEGLLVVYVRSRLAIGSRYTWQGSTWQVAACEYNRAAGSDWDHRVELVRHAA